MVLIRAATGWPFATKYARAMFGQGRETVDVAYPGDVIGAFNATALRPGDTLYDAEMVEFPPIPSFTPEHFPAAPAVGRLQFDVVLRRLEHEFGARAELKHLGYTLARHTDSEVAAGLAGQRDAGSDPPPRSGPARLVHRRVAAGRGPAGPHPASRSTRSWPAPT